MIPFGFAGKSLQAAWSKTEVKRHLGTKNNRYWRYPNRGQDMYFEYKNKMHDANAILEIALIIFVVFRHVSQRSAE